MNEYAATFQRMMKVLGSDEARLLESVGDFREVLTKRHLVNELWTEKVDVSRFKLVIQCPFADLVHRQLRIGGSEGFLCPIAAMGMVARAKEMGWKSDDSIFDYVRFDEKLSHLTSNGSETTFVISGDRHQSKIDES